VSGAVDTAAMVMLVIGNWTTCEARLAWDPAQAIAAARAADRDDLDPVAFALIDQLGAAGLACETFERCIADWLRAFDGLAPGPVPPARLAWLDAALRAHLVAHPEAAFVGWLAALRRTVVTAQDLHWVIRLLLRARSAWRWQRALRQNPWRRLGPAASCW
jgi:hypothetical protein